MKRNSIEYTNRFVLISESFYNEEQAFSTEIFHLPVRGEDGNVYPMCRHYSVGSVGGGVNKHSIKHTDFSDLRPCKNCIREKHELLGVSGEKIEPRKVPYELKPLP